MSYLIEGLDPAPFAPLFALSDEELAARGITVMRAGETSPCRVSLDEAAPGDRLLLVNHMHQPADTPYRASHAIFVAQGSTRRAAYRDTLPPVMRTRPLSIRAFDAAHMMIDADLVDGAAATPLIERMLADPATAYLHVHFAKRGCFAATVVRA
jgi:hypothetical protein